MVYLHTLKPHPSSRTIPQTNSQQDSKTPPSKKLDHYVLKPTPRYGTKTDSYGYVAYTSEDLEGESFTINVERLAVWDPVLKQEPAEPVLSDHEEEDGVEV